MFLLSSFFKFIYTKNKFVFLIKIILSLPYGIQYKGLVGKIQNLIKH